MSMVIPKYHSVYEDWNDTATEDEKTGFQILKFIIETRGYKKYPHDIKRPDLAEQIKSDFK